MEHRPGPEKGEAYGTASLTQALEGVNFPISRNDLIEQVGNRQVEVDKGKMMPMRDLLMACSHEMYNSPVDVVSCPEIEDKMKAA
ncbi:MAG: hypothetical protein K6T91_04435 [Firmicutes bacterium]|nr:hypothetical protein [Bacillota bacterium]